jgi:hypothetical protein
MTANDNLDRRIADYYASEPPLRAPDWVLRTALETIDTTPQRRGLLAPWRFQSMSTYAKLATAVVAVIAVGAIGLWQLVPGLGSGVPIATPSPSPSPTLAPTAQPVPTQSVYVPPELTRTFTSDIHGITISYPGGWTTQAATEAWTGSGFVLFGLPAGDFLYDPVLIDHMFLGLASQRLGDTSFDSWSTGLLAAEGCTETELVVVDGAVGVIALECDIALISSGGRGYAILLNKSDDEAELRAFDARPWLHDVLATVELQPGDAVD